MKYLKYFESILTNPDPNLENINRTTELSEERFLQILNDKCKNFSFMDDELWRGKLKKTDLELFEPNYRNTRGITFTKFFNEIENDPEYPVVRRKSLIGGTDIKSVKIVTGQKELYRIIPFDNSEIVFCPIIDLMGIQDNQKSGKLKDGNPVSKDIFFKVPYTKNFKIPYNEVESIRLKYKLRGSKETGYEFFISSPCLMIIESKLDWLRNNI